MLDQFQTTSSGVTECVHSGKEGRGMFHEPLGKEGGIGLETDDVPLPLLEILKQLHTSHHTSRHITLLYITI